MCFVGLPGKSLGGQIFRNGPSGRVRDALFGRGTSQKITNKVDSITRNSLGRLGIVNETLGFTKAPLGGDSQNIDFQKEAISQSEEDKRAFFRRQKAAGSSSLLGS